MAIGATSSLPILTVLSTRRSANGRPCWARSRRNRLTRGDKSRDQQAGRAVAQRRSIGCRYAAACRLQNRMACCDIPVSCRRQPRIEVGRALGDAAEFYRGAALYELWLRKTIDIAPRL